MPFNVSVFNATLLLDNPTVGRYIRSELHALIALVRGGGFTATQLGVEMAKVSKAKWVKYGRTRAYLLAQFPLLRPRVSDFTTTALKKHLIGIEHQFMCVSSTGDLTDLEGGFIREHVSWDTPSPAIARLMVNDPHYLAPGDHYGNTGGRADWPIPHQDVHGARAPFNADLCRDYTGGPLALTFDQVYEYSVDNRATWHVIPNSGFTLVRTLTRGPRGGCITMKKTSVQHPGESATSDPLYFD